MEYQTAEWGCEAFEIRSRPMLGPGILAFAYVSSPGLARGPHFARGAVHRVAAFAMADEILKCDLRKLPLSAVALDISVPAKITNEIHFKVVAELARNAKVPGFRDGKVPPQAVIAKIGMAKVKEATVEQIIDIGMRQSGAVSKLHTVGEARLADGMEIVAHRYVIGEAFDFTVEVDVYPDVSLDEGKYTGLVVDVENVEFNQEAYDTALRKL